MLRSSKEPITAPFAEQRATEVGQRMACTSLPLPLTASLVSSGFFGLAGLLQITRGATAWRGLSLCEKSAHFVIYTITIKDDEEPKRCFFT